MTQDGQAALEAAAAMQTREEDFLAGFTALCRLFPAELARPALETAILRRQAEAKFPFADRMAFTREALEQSSSYAVSSYRAGRYRPFRRLVDLGCSIGGDTLSLAPIAPVLGVDHDPLRLALAHFNLNALGLSGRAAFVQADLAYSLPVRADPLTGLFFDPARRKDGRRVFSVSQYQPPLDIIRGWLERFPALGVKASPGVDLEELSEYDAEVEFISFEGELKEAVLWFGPLKTAARRATVLPGAHSLSVQQPLLLPGGSTNKSDDRPLPVREPRAYLYEPDPSILRAGLVALLGEQLGASQVDETIAYLTSDILTETPFARAWQVEDWLPFSLKRLRAYLRERHIGHVVVKKRGSPLQPEALIHELKLKGEEERVIVLTQLRGRPIVMICRKCEN
ncbi:MAG: THUMP-like domain-containing protein [Omnitrophica WOR_2 bacterium]